MSGNSKIEWTDRTWNPVTGCNKVSQGCKHCYAEGVADRFFAKQYPPNPDGSPRQFTDVRTHEDRLDAPLHWRKPSMIFVNSMSDLFHPSIPVEFIDRVLEVIEACPQHTFQVLTKRPELIDEKLYGINPECPVRVLGAGDYLPNLWLGVSVELPKYLNRLDILREAPAAVRFVSFEPLLADLGTVNLEGIGWAIVGGESGPKARPMHPKWARSLRDQCVAAGVPFFFKQWGEYISPASGSPGAAVSVALDEVPQFVTTGDGVERELYARVGKHAAGRLLDGREWNEYPECVA